MDKQNKKMNEEEMLAAEEQPQEIQEQLAEAETEETDAVEDSIDPLESKVAELEASLEKEKKEYLFLMAEFDNFRKRTIKEKAEIIKNGAEQAMKGLLPIVDDFERGLEATKDATDAGPVREGMELIYNKLVKYMADNGVQPMQTNGSPFDADLHEAIAQVPVPGDEQKGQIIDTVSKGYTINGKVLRHAKVVVGQ